MCAKGGGGGGVGEVLSYGDDGGVASFISPMIELMHLQ